MSRRKSRTFKKLYKIKVIEHRTVLIEADTAQAAIDSVEGNKDRVVGSARQLHQTNEDGGRTRLVPSKVIKKTAKVISEKDSADAIYARAKRKAAKEAGQVQCTNCGKTRAKHHFYDRVTEMYHGEIDLHEYNTVVGMKRWFEMNKDINKRYGFNNPTDFDKEDIARLKKLGISIT
jgi:hypothetical protein